MKSHDEHLVSLFLETSRRLREWLAAACPTSGPAALTQVRLTTLKHIAERGPITMKELAGHLRVSPPTATLVAAVLSDKGLVRRLVGKPDHRHVRLAVTAKGRRALTAGCRKMSERLRLVLAQLTVAERGQVERLLTRLSAATPRLKE